MASPWIVRHGTMRFLGSLHPGDASYARGDDVVLRTERGHELGQVLCPATPQAVALLAEPTKGRIVRRVDDRDRAERQRLKEREQQELEACARFVAQRRLQMELVDAEHLFGGERIVF